MCPKVNFHLILKNEFEKKAEPSLLRLKLWICPAMEYPGCILRSFAKLILKIDIIMKQFYSQTVIII